MLAYHQWLDERADDAYRIAEQARQLGFDHKDRVEIPRASDLAGRTEKLLIEHLEGYEVADDIRHCWMSTTVKQPPSSSHSP